ncbi:FAD-binding protein [Mycolicibacterium sp. 018/SC-01/001]|uniref:FAD-dependent monooxygenase n=1 Tax=Mycolicibacterium sp. 018/SC-01/001 TaxID=2592069 RepID=UPI00117D6BFF|nr:FAD-dependent monooxygenase [Mycolicibacterium sp. 018/SC-01/001]TRW83321.1 FAD-binding protein [Mycolicibacterium sp. 018/SC-01/001]
MDTTSVVIAGAGIGGLTAALTLHRRGLPVTVVERAQRLQPLGVGINLLPHAVRELDALGLGSALRSISIAPQAIAYFDSAGRHLFSEPRGVSGGHSHPQLSVHRGRLQDLLLTAVRDRLGVDTVRTDSALTGFTSNGRGVVAHTARGDLTASVLVGADGINSVMRSRLHPGPDPLLWSGTTMYRGAARIPPVLDGTTMAIVQGDGRQLVLYPIGGGLVNWVLLVDRGTPGSLPGHARWNHPAEPEVVASHVRDWTLGWLDAKVLPYCSDEVLEYPMVDRNILPHWGDESVTLLGDAAHPMYPVGANGASQAIVDARVLADELAADPHRGLRRYETRRREATAAIVAANREMHRRASTEPGDIARATATYRTVTERSLS